MRGHVVLSSVLDVNAYSAARVDAENTDVTQPLSRLKLDDPVSTAHEHKTHGHAHDLSGISTLAIPLPPRLSDDQVVALDLALQALLWEGRLPAPSPDRPNESIAEGSLEILRTKGYFVTQDGRGQVVQGVREIYEIREVGNRKQDQEEEQGQDKEFEGKLVLIGKGLQGWMVQVVTDAVVRSNA